MLRPRPSSSPMVWQAPRTGQKSRFASLNQRHPIFQTFRERRVASGGEKI